MKLLLSRAAPGVINTIGIDTYRQHMGMLMTPRGGYSVQPVIDAGAVWACDNEAYSSFSRDAFVRMLKKYRGLPNCLFVTAPDVVADAQATMLRFRMWQPVIRYYGYPVALVAQDGLEHLSTDWHSFDALFIGGSTEWKLGKAAAALALEAKLRGKHIHVGRVNSNHRLRVAKNLFADTIDGSGYAKFLKSMLPRSLQVLEQPMLFEAKHYVSAA